MTFFFIVDLLKRSLVLLDSFQYCRSSIFAKIFCAKIFLCQEFTSRKRNWSEDCIDNMVESFTLHFFLTKKGQKKIYKSVTIIQECFNSSFNVLVKDTFKALALNKIDGKVNLFRIYASAACSQINETFVSSKLQLLKIMNDNIVGYLRVLTSKPKNWKQLDLTRLKNRTPCVLYSFQFQDNFSIIPGNA